MARNITNCGPACGPEDETPTTPVTPPQEPCCEGGGGGDGGEVVVTNPVEIDSSCDDPVSVFVCNQADQPVQVISETEQLGCVTDEDGAVVGRAYLVPTFDGDGNITSTRMIMVATDGTVTDPYTGDWEVCGDQEDTCLSCQSTILCDTFVGSGEADITATPIPFEDLPVVSPAYAGQEAMDPATAAELWDGNLATIPASPGPGSSNQVHVSSGAVLGTTEDLTGDVDISVQLNYLRTGPNNGRVNTGGIFLFNGDEQIATSFYPSSTSVGAEGQLILTATVPADDLINGNITVVSISETFHLGQSGGWELSSFIALLGGVEETQTFLRTICRDCDGAVISVTDTTFDGVTEYEVQGNVSACDSDTETSDSCVICETLVLCDTVNDPDTSQGIPWNVVEIEEDADDPEHILHFHMSPVDDPSKIGIVTFQSSTPFNTGGCDNPDVDYAISNPSRRTITLDEVAQEMHAFQFNMIDFDTFEPTYIPTGYPIPTRLGGTAYWTGEPGNNVNILPTESNGTGLLIWDNPPDTLAIQVGNTGGGSSCSNVDFEALTLGTMNKPFLRTICRDCNGEIVSVSNYEMDGVTPYEPVGEVTVCLDSAGSSSDEQPPAPSEPTIVQNRSVYSPVGETFATDYRGAGSLQSMTIIVTEGAVTITDPEDNVSLLPSGVTATWSVVREEDLGIEGFLVEIPEDAAAVILFTTKEVAP